MRIIKHTFLLWLLLNTLFVCPQNNTIDSLKQLLQNEKQDTTRVGLLDYLSNAYVNSHPDSALVFAQQVIALARRIKFIKGEAWGLGGTARAFYITGNYPKSLELWLEALRKYESINDKRNVWGQLSNIALVYEGQGDYRQALNYTFKARAIAESLHDTLGLKNTSINIGNFYEELGLLDSARIYTNYGYELALRIKDLDWIAIALNNLGSIYSKMVGQNAIAMGYYRSAILSFKQAGDDNGLCVAALGMAELFQRFRDFDSSIFYAKLSLKTAQNGGFTKHVLEASNFLATYYKSIHKVDSAYVYQSVTISAKDSMFSQEKTRQLQSLFVDEAMRQQQIEEAKVRAAEERNRNIQYTIMAVGLVCFIIILLLLSQSVIVNEKWIRFLGVLGLLLVFEFINLFIHPYLSDATHHSPPLMLGILVILGALLIPMHHKIEHWIIHKMVTKNKRIRLVAARKTVSKLEEDTEIQ